MVGTVGSGGNIAMAGVAGASARVAEAESVAVEGAEIAWTCSSNITFLQILNLLCEGRKVFVQGKGSLLRLRTQLSRTVMYLEGSLMS